MPRQDRDAVAEHLATQCARQLSVLHKAATGDQSVDLAAAVAEMVTSLAALPGVGTALVKGGNQLLRVGSKAQMQRAIAEAHTRDVAEDSGRALADFVASVIVDAQAPLDEHLDRLEEKANDQGLVLNEIGDTQVADRLRDVEFQEKVKGSLGRLEQHLAPGPSDPHSPRAQVVRKARVDAGSHSSPVFVEDLLEDFDRPRSPEIHRELLGVLLATKSTLEAVVLWLDPTDRPSMTTSDVVDWVVKKWVTQDLLSAIRTAPDLRTNLVHSHGLERNEASSVTRRVLFCLLPLHPKVPPRLGALGSEVMECRRLKCPIDVALGEDGLQAVHGVRPPNPGMTIRTAAGWATAFRNEVARQTSRNLNEVTVELADATQRYLDRVEYNRKRNLPAHLVPRPRFLRLPEEFKPLLPALERDLAGAVHLELDTDPETRRIAEEFIVVLRDLDSTPSRDELSKTSL